MSRNRYQTQNRVDAGPSARRWWHAAAVVAVAALAPSLACTDKRPVDGSERGDCYGNSTCDEGLLCLSRLCVRPPPADCTKVVEKLGFLTLGNYTPRKVRDEFQTRVLDVCKRSHLTKSEGDCVLSARDKRALSKCAKPLVFANCKRMIDHVVDVVFSKTAPDLVTEIARDKGKALRKCRDKLYTKLDEACVLGAKTESELGACKL